MAKKQRAPTSATPDPDASTLKLGNPDPEDISSVDSLLDDVLGGKEDPNANPNPPSGKDPSPSAAPEPEAGDDVIPPIEDEKPPTGPRKKESTPPPAPTQEPAATPPAAEAPATPPSPAPDPNAPPHDPEIDGVTDPRGMNPANQQNFKKLREIARKYKGFANQHAAEVEELKSQVGKVPEDVQKELEENRTFRRMFDITNDPEFKDKFDKPSTEAQEEILALIKKHGATDEHIKIIKEKGISSLPDKWWEENVLKPLRESDSTDENTAATIIKQRLEKVRALSYDRQREVEKAASSGSEFLKTREEAAKAKEQADLGIMQERVLEVQKQIPWAREQEIPKDATPEQRAKIETENKFYKETIEPAFITALNPPNAKARVESALAVCLSFRLHKDVTELKATLQQRDAEIARLKGANIIQKPTSTASAAPKKPTVSDKIGMRSEDAVEAAMREAGI